MPRVSEQVYGNSGKAVARLITPHSKSNIPLGGIVCGAIAALGYTSAHTFLRSLSLTTDAAWVSCIKAGCTVVIFGPWLLWLGARRKFTVPPRSSVLVLIAAGLFVQIAGNLLYQISLGEIGLAVTVPLVMGSMIVSTAIFGKWLLRESISIRMACALALLVLSISILSLGIQQARKGVQPEILAGASMAVEIQMVESQDESNWLPIIAGFYACMSGVSYSILGIAIRWATRRTPISLATPMVIVGLCGVTSLGMMVLWSRGLELFSSTSTSEWRSMVLAGLSNSIAFLALTYALRVLPAIYVNAINVTQIGMAALIGVLFFSEVVSVYLIVGLGTMLTGFFVMANGRKWLRTTQDESISVVAGKASDKSVDPNR